MKNKTSGTKKTTFLGLDTSPENSELNWSRFDIGIWNTAGEYILREGVCEILTRGQTTGAQAAGGFAGALWWTRIGLF